MTTSVSSITPASAPRDAESLMKLGVFQLRLLVEKLGALSNDQEKMAFAKLSGDQKVALAVQLLQKWDQQNGGAQNGVANGVGHAPAPMAPPPVMAPPQGFPVTQVDPAAVAAAAQAAAPPAPAPTTRTRTPRTSQTEAPAPDLGADVLNLLNRISQQNEETNSTLASALKEISKNVSEVATANQQHAENYKAVYGALQGLANMIGSLAQQNALAMALVLPLAEQTLGASREDILGATIGDLPSIQTFVQQALAQQGKA